MYPAANELTNNPKISDLTKKDLLELNLSQIQGNML